MVRELLNMMLDPFYTAFGTFDPTNNLLQTVVVLMFIFGIINWLIQLLK